MIDFKQLKDKELIYKYKKAILKVDGTMSYAPMNWGRIPEVDKILKGLTDRWLKAQQKRAIGKLRSIIRKAKQK